MKFLRSNRIKPDARNEARGLVTALEKLETGFLIVLWCRVLNRFAENSARLQAAKLLLTSSRL